jgi:hypothetical protein
VVTTSANDDRPLSEPEVRAAMHFIFNYPDELWRQLPIERIEQYNESLRRLAERLNAIVAEE